MKGWGLYALIAVGFIGYKAMTSADRDASGAIVDAGSVDAFKIRVGDCFDDGDPSAAEVGSLPAVPCSEPHDNEVYAVFDVSVAAFPEGDAMGQLAFNSCKERFSSFVNLDYDSSSLDIMTLYPSAESWSRQSDREVVCAVYEMNGEKLTGSAKGLAQ